MRRLWAVLLGKGKTEQELLIFWEFFMGENLSWKNPFLLLASPHLGSGPRACIAGSGMVQPLCGGDQKAKSLGVYQSWLCSHPASLKTSWLASSTSNQNCLRLLKLKPLWPSARAEKKIGFKQPLEGCHPEVILDFSQECLDGKWDPSRRDGMPDGQAERRKIWSSRARLGLEHLPSLPNRQRSR